MFKVSVSVFMRSTDVSRYGFDTAASMAGSMYPMESFGAIWRWLRESDMSAVSDFIFSRLIDADALNLQSSIFTPRLPRHFGFEGKSIEPY